MSENFEADLKLMRRSNTMYFNDKPVLEYNIEYFNISNSKTKACRLINRRMLIDAINLEEHIRKRLYPNAVRHYMGVGRDLCSFTYEKNMFCTYNKDMIVSFFCESTDNTYQNINKRRSSSTYSLKNGQKLSLSSFFKLRVLYKETFLIFISYYIADRIISGSDIFFDNWNRLIYEKFKAENFYLTSEGFIFYYQPGEIAIKSEGVIEFVIPYSAVKDELRLPKI